MSTHAESELSDVIFCGCGTASRIERQPDKAITEFICPTSGDWVATIHYNTIAGNA